MLGVVARRDGGAVCSGEGEEGTRDQWQSITHATEDFSSRLGAGSLLLHPLVRSVRLSVNVSVFRMDELVLLLEDAERDVLRGKPAAALAVLRSFQPDDLSLIEARPDLFARYLDCGASAHKQAGNLEQAMGAYDLLQILAQKEVRRELFGRAVVGKLVVLTNADLPGMASSLVSRHGGDVELVAEAGLQVEFAARRARVLEELGEIESARDVVEDVILPRSEHVDAAGYQLEPATLGLSAIYKRQ